MPLPSEQVMHTAVCERDAAFDGQFLYAVITTGVFCQPSCPSRTPRVENLRFYATPGEAIAAGFRPCKRCSPIDLSQNIEAIVRASRYIEAHSDERLTLAHLADHVDLSPSHLQKRFKQVFGITPKAFQDALRMRTFKQSLKDGESVTDAIYTAGFGSASRVYGEASRDLGMTPSHYRAGAPGEPIHFACRKNPLGWLMMAATEQGVCFVEFGDSEAVLLEKLLSEFPKARLNRSTAQEGIELDNWLDALNTHLADNAPCPTLPLDLRGTAFQIQVWTFLQSTREGDTMSYGELANAIGKPKATRAVASACARNRIGVLIPCHRVLRGDGSLGGYRWGLARKQRLLEQEKDSRKTSRQHSDIENE